MTRYEIQWFFNKELLGISFSNTRETLHSLVRVCPICGDSWSTIVVKDLGQTVKFHPESRRCHNHQGGVIDTFENHYNPPEPVIAHELRYFLNVLDYQIFLITGGN